MANRYCLNGCDRFLSVDGSGNVAIFEEGVFNKSVNFTPERWAQFVVIFDEINTSIKKLVEQKSDVKYRHHIGWKWYTSVTSNYQCVDIRQFYWHREKGPSPSKRGIALRLHEWTNLVGLISHLHLQHPKLADAVPCWAKDDHNNQVC
jgi:hypothetical protein